MAFTTQEYERIARESKGLPSHHQMARTRAARQKLQASQASDPLAKRVAGWVLAEQTKRRAARARAKLEAERQRLEDAFMPFYRAAGFRQAVDSSWVDGSGHSTSVYVAEHLGMEPSAHSEATKVWASKKIRSATYSTHQFWLPRAWARRVQANGIALIDGLLTLDAKKLPRAKVPLGLSDAYQVTWCRQSVGTSMACEHGYMGRLSPEHPWVHVVAGPFGTMGTTLDILARLARRRAESSKNDDRRATRLALREKAIDAADWSAVWPDMDFTGIHVCMVDSEKVGNCDPGTKAWVAKHMPQYIGVDCAPATEVLAAAARDFTPTRRRAVAAVHRAILRSRKAAA